MRKRSCSGVQMGYGEIEEAKFMSAGWRWWWRPPEKSLWMAVLLGRHALGEQDRATACGRYEI